jgi:two-component system, sensor histidine kinase and response regulator
MPLMAYSPAMNHVGSATELPSPRPKILSVDDHASNRLAMRELLEPLGYEVVDAASGHEAIARAADDEFALFVLDVMMPGLDGLDTLSRLRQTAKFPHTPTILVTAMDSDPQRLERAYALGVVDYIEKPIAVEVLRGKVRALVALYEVNRQLRARDAALAMKDRHIAILAHDLRNPLNTILGAAQVTLRSNDLAAAHRAGERVVRAANRMVAMIRDLLDHARAAAGRLSISREPLDLGALTRELIEEFEVADPNRHISLEVLGDVHGDWDVARVYQALSNLVGNATHYGGGRAGVTLADRGEAVEVAVVNVGPPIPPDLLPTLFQPFKRGHDDGMGLGLGLYIVDLIARAHGGTVTVESNLARGTTFLLRLPREEQAKIE